MSCFRFPPWQPHRGVLGRVAVVVLTVLGVACGPKEQGATDAAPSGVAAEAAPTALPPLRTQRYRWQSVAIGGGGFVTGVEFHPTERGLYYARTDVGGAYRWEEAERRWIPLTDWIGMAEANLTGIESLALDPADPERVYLAAGTYVQAGRGAILASADRGRTFTRVDLPFGFGGNQAGRSNGERLAVDPHDGRVLFFGSRADGLWRSADRGATWARVATFPEAATSEGASTDLDRRWPQPVGIVVVAFDPGSGQAGAPTPVLYAAVATRETSLFRSRDAGATWAPVPGQPTGLRPNHLVRAGDGALYLSYGDEPGPNAMNRGAVWKLAPDGGAAADTWTDITPVPRRGSGFGWGAVTVDARDPRVLLASTFCRWAPPQDDVYRSTDGGRTWQGLFARSDWDHSLAPWTEHARPHWIGDVEINPFDADHIIFTTGYGLWASHNGTAVDRDPAARVQWWFQNTNLEETVPLGLISPPEGAPLISALGDLDGFRHDDLTRSPRQFSAPPRFGNSESITFAAQAPLVLVRSGTGRDRRRVPVRAALSRDGGATWQALASEPPTGDGSGTIAVSADGATIIWTPQHAATAYRTRDGGNKWLPCVGLPGALRVIADPAEARCFHAFDAGSGQLFTSTDGGASFTGRAVKPAAARAVPWGFGGGAQAVMLHASPAGGGELWLASREGGLFHSAAAGREFTRLPGVEQAWSLGFGRAIDGATKPALYLAGRVQGVAGLFRSDDDARSWVRINDEAHQFGWVNHVTGDPRRAGRIYFATGGRGIFYGDPE